MTQAFYFIIVTDILLIMYNMAKHIQPEIIIHRKEGTP